MEAKITASSQTFRLRERAEEARLRHGQEVRADLPNVRVLAGVREVGWWTRHTGGADTQPKEAEIFFCNMGELRVHQVMSDGDEAPLPTEATIEGLDVAETGFYDLKDVLVRSNGKFQLVVDEQSRVERVALGGATMIW